MKRWLPILFLSLLTLAGCRDRNDKTFSGYLNCLINSTTYESNNPEFSTSNFSDPSSGNTLTRTRLDFPGNNGGFLNVYFEGEETGNFTITSNGVNSAFYSDINANDYFPTTGIISITEYKTANGETTITGNFEFSAQSQISQSFLQFTNANFSITKYN
jgi:hypothetical protein